MDADLESLTALNATYVMRSQKSEAAIIARETRGMEDAEAGHNTT